MFNQTDIQTIFNPPQTVENRIRQAIPTLFESGEFERFKQYQWDFKEYCQDILDSTPWSMQLEIADAYILALRQQHEKMAFENGELPLDDLEYWQPGQIIQNWIAIDAGHTSGKTYLLAKLVSHFFDCYAPSIIYCFAPTSEQINDLLFKEIRVDRRNRDLPGLVLPRDTRIKYKADHFVTGRATNNANSTGTERVHGQHGKYLMFILDEAEGIPDFVWDSVQSMTGGGISIVVSARNPRTTTCRAHRVRSLSKTAAFRISCLDVPNVIEGREVIPNLARRDYIIDMLEYTDVVGNHNSEKYTFEMPWLPGVIYQPQSEFLWRVLGIASEQVVNNTFCPYGRYDAAVERGKTEPFVFTAMDDKATFGVDAARFGGDFTTVYVKRGNWLYRTGNFQNNDSFNIYHHILEHMEELVADGVVHIEIRVDAGGGWGAGLIDLLRYDLELQYRHVVDVEDLKELLEYATTREHVKQIQQQIRLHAGRNGYMNKWQDLIEFQIYEVNFNGVTDKPRDFYDKVTEMYFYLGAQMKVLCLRAPPRVLRVDICERPYVYGMNGGYSVKKLLGKDDIIRKYRRSPDDGDGAALSAAPSHIFKFRPMILHAG